MRLIDADWLIEVIEGIDWYHYNDVLKEMIQGANSDVHTPWYKAPDIYDAIEQAPTIDINDRLDEAYAHGWTDAEAKYHDAVEVVRCRECKYWVSDGGAMMICGITNAINHGEHYCSYGERGAE